MMRMMYPDAHEDLPHNMPEPRGEPIQLNVFVDADHAGDKITRRSQTGIYIMGNLAPIAWYSKRQTTVESSTFGSEFVALRIATEMVISLRYKLRMFGVPVVEPAQMFCDNEAVVRNAEIPESTFRKKHTSVSYHRVREAVAAGVILIFKEDSATNLADLFTKPLGPEQRKCLLCCMFG